MIVQVLPLKGVLTACLRTDLWRKSQLNSIYNSENLNCNRVFVLLNIMCFPR